MSRALGVVIGLGLAVVASADVSLSGAPRLCSLLGSIHTGEERQVEVSGVYLIGPEQQILYDPRTPVCEFDVQPETWVEFAPGALDADTVTRPGDRFYVTFRGRLQGPGLVEEDDPRIPVIGSYANRTAFDRYGHLGSFRTRLVVEEVLDFNPVPADTNLPLFEDSSGVATAPRVRQGALPRYPERARRAGIKGIVEMRVEVEHGTIMKIDRVSGDRMLAESSRAAIESWQFDKAYTGAFVTTFRYNLKLGKTGANPNTELEIQLPYEVHLTALADGW